METRTGLVKELNNIFEMSANQLVLLCGSTASEKEQIIRSFISDKKFFYHRCRCASAELTLDFLKKEIESKYDVHIAKNSYDECFNRIRSGDSSKLVVVIDEFQNIGRKNREFVESIIKLRAKKLYPGPVMIILLTSSLSYVERDAREVFGDDFDSIDHIHRIPDFSFLEMVRAFPDYSVKSTVEAYGILGGVPAYVRKWDGKRSTRENIIRLIVNPSGLLHKEAEDFIAGELRELSVYDTILAAMAAGNEKLNDLYRVTGYSRAKISVYLKNLAAFDVVEKVVSFDTGGWDNAKKGIYRIKNNLVDFYFHFIYPNLSDLYHMDEGEFYDKYIAPELSGYMRRYFVDVCNEYIILMNRMDKLPIHIRKLGTWVGKEGTIDIMGADDIRENVVGICNWDKDSMPYSDYEELLTNMKLAKIKAKGIYLFSATKFDEQLRIAVKNDSSVVLVDMTEL